MKTNLKTFPNWDPYIEHYEKWVCDFASELREMLSKEDDSCPTCMKIKEILGE
jgi:hypothetical protein